MADPHSVYNATSRKLPLECIGKAMKNITSWHFSSSINVSDCNGRKLDGNYTEFETIE